MFGRVFPLQITAFRETSYLYHLERLNFGKCSQNSRKMSSTRERRLLSDTPMPDSSDAVDLLQKEGRFKELLNEVKEGGEETYTRGKGFFQERAKRFSSFKAKSLTLRRPSIVSIKAMAMARLYWEKKKKNSLEYWNRRKILRKELWANRKAQGAEFLLKHSGFSSLYMAEKAKQMERARIWTVPNMLTIGRMFACPGIGWLIINGHYELALAGATVMGATDWLDGYIARNYNQQSLVGSFLDPLADKLFLGTLGGSMAWNGLLPWQLVALMMGRDCALVAGVLIQRSQTRKEGEPFFNLQSINFEVNPSLLSKVNTGLQMGFAALALAQPVFGLLTPEYLDRLCWFVGASTFLSGVGYIGKSGMKPMKRILASRQFKSTFSKKDSQTGFSK